MAPAVELFLLNIVHGNYYDKYYDQRKMNRERVIAVWDEEVNQFASGY